MKTKMSKADWRKRMETITDATRKDLEALFREHFVPRDDGGLDYNLDDHLWQVYQSRMDGSDDELLYRAYGGWLPDNYFDVLRNALGL
jgi:hypothetical protein